MSYVDPDTGIRVEYTREIDPLVFLLKLEAAVKILFPEEFPETGE